MVRVITRRRYIASYITLYTLCIAIYYTVINLTQRNGLCTEVGAGTFGDDYCYYTTTASCIILYIQPTCINIYYNKGASAGTGISGRWTRKCGGRLVIIHDMLSAMGLCARGVIPTRTMTTIMASQGS